MDPLTYPFDPSMVLRKQRQLRRELSENRDLTPLRVAILGGSTTHELAGLLELFLLHSGFRPVIYESEYNMYFEEAVVDNQRLVEFAPDFILVYTSSVNLRGEPNGLDDEAELEKLVTSELSKWQAVWSALTGALPCQIIQTNFDPPALRTLGNLDGSRGGLAHLASLLNREFNRMAQREPKLIVHDTAALAGSFGTANWYDPQRWFAYKIVTSPHASVALAHSLVSLIGAARGRSKKALLLDLDNTLWGGVIGDDGLERIVLGRETPLGEAYRSFQSYCLRLRQRGILLAICSKNDDATAREGFRHPDSVLSLDDFAAFKANWDPKPDNIRAIAQELNIGLDSLVFVDDNPAERVLVASQLPMVAVPEVGSNVALFPGILDRSGYFEIVSLSAEDRQRTELYAQNATRTAVAETFASYDAYLDSLAMSAEIEPFSQVYLDRITQLTNKTNQFNLTTRRYTRAQIEQIADADQYVALYGRLVDIFGDNGLVSVVIGRRNEAELHVELWLMSCRVIKRGMEQAMLDALVQRARGLDLATIVGYYSPTAKNGMVADHYRTLGFSCVDRSPDGSSRWSLDITGTYTPRNERIRELSHV
jgi:FkbH-like protein